MNGIYEYVGLTVTLLTVYSGFKILKLTLPIKSTKEVEKDIPKEIHREKGERAATNLSTIETNANICELNYSQLEIKKSAETLKERSIPKKSTQNIQQKVDFSSLLRNTDKSSIMGVEEGLMFDYNTRDIHKFAPNIKIDRDGNGNFEFDFGQFSLPRIPTLRRSPKTSEESHNSNGNSRVQTVLDTSSSTGSESLTKCCTKTKSNNGGFEAPTNSTGSGSLTKDNTPETKSSNGFEAPTNSTGSESLTKANSPETKSSKDFAVPIQAYHHLENPDFVQKQAPLIQISDDSQSNSRPSSQVKLDKDALNVEIYQSRRNSLNAAYDNVFQKRRSSIGAENVSYPIGSRETQATPVNVGNASFTSPGQNRRGSVHEHHNQSKPETSNETRNRYSILTLNETVQTNQNSINSEKYFQKQDSIRSILTLNETVQTNQNSINSEKYFQKQDSIRSILTLNETVQTNQNSINSEKYFQKQDSIRSSKEILVPNRTLSLIDPPTSPPRHSRYSYAEAEATQNRYIFDSPTKIPQSVTQPAIPIRSSSDQTKEVLEISLDYKLLKSIPITTFSRSLKMLNLSYNNIRTIPNSISSLQSLEYIYIRNNLLTTLPYTISELQNLKILDLANNKLTSIENNSFIDMSDLQILDISGNVLTFIPTSVGYLKSLRTFLMDSNPFETHIQTLVDPLIECYQNIIIKSNEKRKSRNVIDSDLPGRCYLLRIQGFLADLYDLEESLLYKNPEPLKIEYANRIDLKKYVGLNRLGCTKRDFVVREILETERKYVKELSSLEDLYFKPLKKLKILTNDELEIVFSNLKDIINLHKKLILPALESLCSGDHLIGAFFKSLVPFLKIYSLYMNTFDTTMKFLQLLGGGIAKCDLFLNAKQETRMRFQAFERLAKNQSNHTQINIGAFLILPIQRLPRYQLLVKSLVEQSVGHPDYEKSKEAFEDVKKLVDFCNENKRHTELKLKTLERLLVVNISQDSVLYPYLKPSAYRGLIHESSSMYILKIVQHHTSMPALDANMLCKKRSQIKFTSKGVLREYKFKPNGQKEIRAIESSGQSARFDISGYDGKGCILFLCNDCVLVCNRSFELVGFFGLGRQCTITCLPKSQTEGVMRLSDGVSVVYIRGVLTEIINLVGLINSFVL